MCWTVKMAYKHSIQSVKLFKDIEMDELWSGFWETVEEMLVKY
jgi:hypothetical protein